MTFDPHADNYSPPSPADASRLLGEIAPVSRRSQRLARDVTFARPLLAWGLAWMAGALLYQFVPGPGGAIGGMAACAAAAATTWLVRPREVRHDNERRFTLVWWVLFASSPLLLVVAAPQNGRLAAVFLGCLWALGMLLYGIGVRDLPVAALGLGILAVAAATRLAAPRAAMLAVGLAGGLVMAALGAWRMRWRR